MGMIALDALLSLSGCAPSRGVARTLVATGGPIGLTGGTILLRMVARLPSAVALIAFVTFGAAEGWRPWAHTAWGGQAAPTACADDITSCDQHPQNDETPSPGCTSMPAGTASTCSAAFTAVLGERVPELLLGDGTRRPPMTSDHAATPLFTRGIFHPPRA